MNNRITDVFELCRQFAGWDETDVQTAQKRIYHRIYSETDCGANVLFSDQGITITSIVEGYEAEFSTDELVYPFTLGKVYQAMDWIDGEVSAYLEENEDENDN